MSEAHEDHPAADAVALQGAIDRMAAEAKAKPAAAHEAVRSEALRDVLRRFAVPDRALVSQIPKGNTKLDYVGHADLTAILITVDPLWSWEPVAWDDDGGPKIRDGGKVWELWGRMTLLGKTLPAVGSCEKSKADVGKELIGDFLRNAGLRFGIATSLWSRSEWDMDAIAGPAETERPTSRPAPAQPRQAPARSAVPAATQTAPSAPPADPKDWVAMALAEACATGHGRTRLLSASRDMAREAGVELPKTVDDVRAHPMAEQFAAWAAENLHAQAI